MIKRSRYWQTPFARGVLVVVLAIGAIALVRDTAYQGQDFAVFWRAAVRVLHGGDLYSSADGPMVFKYPPWVVPFFFPFSLFPLSLAKWLWGIVQVASLVGIVRILWKNRLRPLAIFSCLALYWGIWAVHCLDGQVNLPMTFLTMWIWIRWKDSSWKAAQPAALFVVLSTKIITLVPMVYFLVSRLKVRPFGRDEILAFGVVLLLTIPALGGRQGHLPTLMHEWKESAFSGGVKFTGQKIRLRENQGLPAAALRALDVRAENRTVEIAITWAILFIVVGLALWVPLRWKIQLQPVEAVALWLAVIPVVHPLAWFHLFAFSFPLAVLVVHAAIASRRTNRIVAAYLAVLMVGAITQKTLGRAGYWLEFGSIKSWGVLVLGALFMLLKRPTRHIPDAEDFA